jgi:hypothetical protein
MNIQNAPPGGANVTIKNQYEMARISKVRQRQIVNDYIETATFLLQSNPKSRRMKTVIKQLKRFYSLIAIRYRGNIRLSFKPVRRKRSLLASLLRPCGSSK